MNRKWKLPILAGLVALLASMSGCGFLNKLRAKNSLNEGVRDFNGGKYAEAQGLFAEALQYDPDNANAQLFYARAINAGFEQKQTEELGMKALDAYQNIINHNKDNPKAVDQALAFESKVYDELAGINPKEADQFKDKSRETLLKRSSVPGATNKVKADVYYTIGQGYWKDSHALSGQYTKTLANGKLEMQTIPPATVAQMKNDILKAHEYLQKALSIEPDYADAWVYEKLVYMEETKVETNSAKRAELDKKIAEAQENYKKYHEQQQAAAQAAPSP